MSFIKKLWSQSALTSSIEGVLREVSKGRALEAQKWYHKYRTELASQALKQGIDESDVQRTTFDAVGVETAVSFKEVLARLRQPGGPFAEVDEYLDGK